MEENVLHVGLIAGRHPLPVEGYVWKDAIEEPTDFVSLENHAANWIHDVVSYDLGTQPADVLYLYVTGLTSALTSFLKVWYNLGYHMADHLVLMHYDRELEAYVPQQWVV